MSRYNIYTYKIGKTTIQIDRSKCISCATCTVVAPEVFELDDDLICRVKENPLSKDTKLIREAVSNCTSEALKIIED